jgi:hypothetical protein
MLKPSRTAPTRLLQIFCALLLLLPSAAATLTAPSNLEGLDEEDRQALEAIATRDEDVRDAALVAAQHVGLLVEVQRIQEQSSERFREAVDAQPEEVQEMIWDVVQVPGLLEELGTDGPRLGSELDAIVARHPEELESGIRALGRSHYVLVGELLRIDRVAWDRFDVLVEDLPEDSQQALRTLVDDPELLSILARHVRLGVYLGDSYREDPDGTRRHLTELGTEVALRDAAAEEEWRTTMESDEEAAAELERSARFYADEYGYDYDELTDYEVTTVRTEVYHYPYWFGYPARYADSYLYPYGYWYAYPIHLGFYFGGGGYHYGPDKVYFGVPSRHYLNWYFGGHHDRHYKRLSHRFSKHHRTHRYARDHRYRTISYWDKHRGRRDRHGDWHRGKRHDGRHGWHARAGRRSDEPRRERRFFGDRKRRDDRHSSRFTPEGRRKRRDGDSTRRDGDRTRQRDERRIERRDDDTRSRRDSEPKTRTGKARRRDKKTTKQDPETKTQRAAREHKASGRRDRIPSKARRIQKRERGSKGVREARTSLSEPKRVRSAKRGERSTAKATRKAAKRTDRQVRQASKQSSRQVRKASHSSPRRARAAKASRRSQKVAQAGSSGAGESKGGNRGGGRWR